MDQPAGQFHFAPDRDAFLSGFLEDREMVGYTGTAHDEIGGQHAIGMTSGFDFNPLHSVIPRRF